MRAARATSSGRSALTSRAGFTCCPCTVACRIATSPGRRGQSPGRPRVVRVEPLLRCARESDRAAEAVSDASRVPTACDGDRYESLCPHLALRLGAHVDSDSVER